MTASEWQARIDVLEKMVTAGVLSSRHGDTQLTYRSMDELLKALSYAKSQLNEANGASRAPGYVKQDSKGYC